MHISRRAEETQASPIRKLVPFANEARARGVKILHLNIGQPDINTPKVVADTLHDYNDEVLAYSPSDGFGSLKEVYVSYLKYYKIHVDTSNVSITTGGSEAIIFAIAAMCDFGDNIIIPEPFYANYKSFATMLGVEIIPVTTYVENNFHIIDIKALYKEVNDKTRALLICNPGNPTGNVYTKEEIQGLASFAIEKDLFIISDEVYREFLYDGVEFASPLSVKEVENRVILTDSISKRYSACGARVGFLVSKNKDIMQAVLKFSMARLSPPTLGQRIAERLFSLDFSYFDGVIKEYELRRNALLKDLGEAEGISLAKPEGAFYMIARLDGVDSEDFAKFLLNDFSIDGETAMVSPLTGFYSTPGLGVDEIRIAYVLNEEKIKRATRIIKEGLSAYRKKSKSGVFKSLSTSKNK